MTNSQITITALRYQVQHTEDAEATSVWYLEKEEYLESLVLDELLDAIHDEEEALLVAEADVAGVKPSVRVDGGSRRLRVPIVAQHHLKIGAVFRLVVVLKGSKRLV